MKPLKNYGNIVIPEFLNINQNFLVSGWAGRPKGQQALSRQGRGRALWRRGPTRGGAALNAGWSWSSTRVRPQLAYFLRSQLLPKTIKNRLINSLIRTAFQPSAFPNSIQQSINLIWRKSCTFRVPPANFGQRILDELARIFAANPAFRAAAGQIALNVATTLKSLLTCHPLMVCEF